MHIYMRIFLLHLRLSDQTSGSHNSVYDVSLKKTYKYKI